jgi:hypothetical protein
MKYVVGERTAARLKEVLATVKGPKGGNPGVAGARQVIVVEVTGPIDDDGFFPCAPSQYLTLDGEWEVFGDCLAIGANSEALAVGTRYLAIRAGDTEDGDAVFVAVGPIPRETYLGGHQENDTGVSAPTVDVQVGDLVLIAIIYTSTSGEQTITPAYDQLGAQPLDSITVAGHDTFGTNLFYWFGWYYFPDDPPQDLWFAFSDSLHLTAASMSVQWFRDSVINSFAGEHLVLFNTGTGSSLETADFGTGGATDAFLLAFTGQVPGTDLASETSDGGMLSLMPEANAGNVRAWRLAGPTSFGAQTFQRSTSAPWWTAILCLSPRGAGPVDVPYGSITGLPAALDAIDGLTPATDKLAYYTGSTTAGLTDLSTFGRSLIDDADGDASLATLGGTAPTGTGAVVRATGATVHGMTLDGGTT